MGSLAGYLLKARLLVLLLSKKLNLDEEQQRKLNLKVKSTNWNLITSFKGFKMNSFIKKYNFDIKSVILWLFFYSSVINRVILVFLVVANVLYSPVFFIYFFNVKFFDIDPFPWNWVVTLILNVLIFLFIFRSVSDGYKTSLRGNYRNNYVKLLFLDICTINILSVIGTLIFAKNKNHMLQVHDDFRINYHNLNTQIVKEYFKLLVNLEIYLFLLTIVTFLIALVGGYFILSNAIKIICFIVIIWDIMLYGILMFGLVEAIVIQKMFKNLLVDNSYYYLLTIIRFLQFSFGYYYPAILINVLAFDEETKKFILESY